MTVTLLKGTKMSAAVGYPDEYYGGTDKPPAMKIMMTPSLVARRTLIPMNTQMGMAKTRISVTIVKVNVEKPKAGE